MNATTRETHRTGRLALTLALALPFLIAGAGCAHQRESLYPPKLKVARGEPSLDPSTPGVTQSAAAKPVSSGVGTGSTATAKRPETRSREVDTSADTFDFDAYRD